MLGWAVVGNTYLWFLAALLQFVIVVYGHDVLRVDEKEISYLQAAVGIGIGVGSLAAGYLSRGKIENRLVPIGGIGMTVFGFLVSRPGLGIWPVRVDLCLLGFFGGFYAVPLNALIQHRPKREEKGGVIAGREPAFLCRRISCRGTLFCALLGCPLPTRHYFSCRSLHDACRDVLRVPSGCPIRDRCNLS